MFSCNTKQINIEFFFCKIFFVRGHPVFYFIYRLLRYERVHLPLCHRIIYGVTLFPATRDYNSINVIPHYFMQVLVHKNTTVFHDGCALQVCVAVTIQSNLIYVFLFCVVIMRDICIFYHLVFVKMKYEIFAQYF